LISSLPALEKARERIHRPAKAAFTDTIFAAQEHEATQGSTLVEQRRTEASPSFSLYCGVEPTLAFQQLKHLSDYICREALY